MQGFYQEGRREGTFQDGIELALRRILTSPQFLVRAEREPENVAPGQPYRITDLELASRLSFLLWSSIPDDELIDVASQNKLHTSAGAGAAGAAHAGRSQGRARWWRTSAISCCTCGICPPLRRTACSIPTGTTSCARASGARRNCCFESIIKENRNVVDLLTADYTFLNERLAQALRHPQHLRLAIPPREPRARSWPIAADCWGRAACCRSRGCRTSGPRR